MKISFLTYKSVHCSCLQAVRMIKQLAEDNKNQIKKETTEDTLKVYQLLRMLQDRDLDEMWVELARNNEHRWVFVRWLQKVIM